MAPASKATKPCLGANSPKLVLGATPNAAPELPTLAPNIMSFHPDKTYLSMTPAEIAAAKKLTAEESRALANLFRAVRRLPLGLTVEVDEEGMVVRKQVTYGAYLNVGQLRRKTLKNGRKAPKTDDF